MVRIGIVGVGFMGMIHYLTYEKLRSAKVVALCDPKRKRLRGDWRDIQGNFGPRGSKVNLTDTFVTSDWRQLVTRADIDLVDVCVPPARHREVAVAALQSGKHVFCEKPIALQEKKGKQMLRAAKAADRELMIGHVLPLFPEYQYALSAARSQKFGAVLGGHFRRVISDPKWLPDFYDPEKVGGPMLDLHIHDAHFIRLLFGTPTHVSTTGRMRGEVAEYFSTQFQFNSTDHVVTATSGVIRQPGRPFLHGYEIHFERATVMFEFAVVDGEPLLTTPCTVLPTRGKARRPQLGDGDPMVAFEKELKAVLRSIRTGKVADFLQCEPALDALRICQKQTESLRKRSRVAV